MSPGIEPKSTLVVDATRLIRLAVDGPALRVRIQGCSDMLFPFRRILRVQVIGVPRSGFDALIACAERRIPVAFFDGCGRYRCRLGPPAIDPTGVDARLEQIEYDCCSRAVYEEWKRNQSAHLLSLLGVGDPAARRAPDRVRKSLFSTLRQQLIQKDLEEAQNWIQGMLTFHLEQALDAVGPVTHMRIRSRLIQDLSERLVLIPLIDLAATSTPSRAQMADARAATHLYRRTARVVEHHAIRMLFQLIELLDRLD